MGRTKKRQEAKMLSTRSERILKDNMRKVYIQDTASMMAGNLIDGRRRRHAYNVLVRHGYTPQMFASLRRKAEDLLEQRQHDEGIDR